MDTLGDTSASPPVVSFTLRLLDAADVGQLATVCVQDFVGVFGAASACVRDEEGPWCELVGEPGASTVTMSFRLSAADERPVRLDLEIEAGPDVPIIRQQFLDLVAVVRRAWKTRRLLSAAQQSAGEDALTGLQNRRGIEGYLNRAMKDARITGRPLTVMLVDLDHFKAVNDAQGHPAGDDVLRAAAECFREHLRPADRVCRWGGDEFLLLLPGLPADAAAGVAERLRRAFEGLGRARGTTMSIGIADRAGVQVGQDAEVTAAQLIEVADACLYQAKRAGRNQVRQAAVRIGATG